MNDFHRAVELEKQRIRHRRVGRVLRALPVEKPKPREEGRRLPGRCAICGSYTQREWYCAAHAWIGEK